MVLVQYLTSPFLIKVKCGHLPSFYVYQSDGKHCPWPLIDFIKEAKGWHHNFPSQSFNKAILNFFISSDFPVQIDFYIFTRFLPPFPSASLELLRSRRVWLLYTSKKRRGHEQWNREEKMKWCSNTYFLLIWYQHQALSISSSYQHYYYHYDHYHYYNRARWCFLRCRVL